MLLIILAADVYMFSDFECGQTVPEKSFYVTFIPLHVKSLLIESFTSGNSHEEKIGAVNLTCAICPSKCYIVSKFGRWSEQKC